MLGLHLEHLLLEVGLARWCVQLCVVLQHVLFTAARCCNLLMILNI